MQVEDEPVVPVAKRAAGRPRGTLGDGLLRKRLRSLEDEELAPGIVQDKSSKSKASHSLNMPEAKEISCEDSFADIGSTLQKQLFQFSRVQAKADIGEMVAGSEPMKNVGHDILCQGTRPVSSATVLAKQSEDSIRQISRNERRVAASVIEVSGHVWASCLHMIRNLIQHEGWEGLVIAKKRRYDETPLSVRLAGDAKDESSDNTGVKAKILQSEYTLMVLVYHAARDQYVHFEGRLPTWLQVIESCTANIIRRAQLDIESIVQNLHLVAECFLLRATLPCTDRHPSNIACENQLCQEQKGWTLTHTFCTVHRCATCTKSALSLLEGHVSGVLSIGLCCQMAGCTKELRKHLSAILSERLEIRIGPPQCVEYRNEVYRLCLQTIDTSKKEKKKSEKSDKMPHLPKKQQLILDTLFNGDIQSTTITHWTTVPRERSEVLGAFDKYAVGALIPHRCPRLHRGNFLGHEKAFSWVALLALHHQLLEPVITRYCHFAQTVPKQVVAPPAEGVSSRSDSWKELQKRRANKGQQSDAARVQRPSMFELPEATPKILQEHDNFDPDINWAEQNKANQRKAAAYAASNPGPILFVLLIILRPVGKRMQDFIFLSSDDWDDCQQASCLTVGARSFRVMELLDGKQTSRLMASVSRLLLVAPCQLPCSCLTSATRTLMFRLLSREASAVQHYMLDVHKSFPFKVFDTLNGRAEEVLAQEPCLRDDLANWILTRFTTREELESAKAVNILSSLAHCISVDILQIEARHSAARRLTIAKSCQTWTLPFQMLSAEWTNRQQVRMQSTSAQLAQQKQRSRVAKPNRKRKALGSKKRSGGGAYRAFLHLAWKGKNTSQAACEYKRLRAENGVAWQRILELGNIATAARRQGQLPLREARYRNIADRKRQQRLSTQPVLSEIEARLQVAQKDWQQLSVTARTAENEQLALVEGQMLEHGQEESVVTALPTGRYASQAFTSQQLGKGPAFTMVKPDVAAVVQDMGGLLGWVAGPC